jgi:hypothetical protein
MDVNLTGNIAATLVENLKQSWYSPIITVGAGILGGIVGGAVTGIITLTAVNRTNASAERRDELNRKEEARRVRREERKKAYINFMTLINRMDHMVANRGAFPLDLEEYSKSLSKIYAEITLLSPEMIEELAKISMKYPNMKESFETSGRTFPKT